MNTKNVKEDKLQKIKIELDTEAITIPDPAEDIRWENDGGRIPDVLQMIDNSLLPLKPGDTFRVKRGHLTEENDRVYYIAEIECLE
ncbi:MAG: hypothetical protein U5K71_04910 [Gracilimonas sp.]|nr:hypothetical protein [Gracilimonas sp.]